MRERRPSSLAVPGRTRRVLYFLAGSFALALGVLGVVLPLLPTTPFVIVAAFCYARSSERVHSWLLANRVFGRQLNDYLSGSGVSWRVKAGALVLLWTSICLSAVLFAPFLWVRVLLGAIGTGVSAHVLMIKTRRASADA
jgi:uncharacterized membrane protein YbaN (DUF454 family)